MQGLAACLLGIGLLPSAAIGATPTNQRLAAGNVDLPWSDGTNWSLGTPADGSTNILIPQGGVLELGGLIIGSGGLTNEGVINTANSAGTLQGLAIESSGGRLVGINPLTLDGVIVQDGVLLGQIAGKNGASVSSRQSGTVSFGTIPADVVTLVDGSTHPEHGG